MQVAVVVTAIENARAACGNNVQCQTQATEAILNQVAANVANPAELAAILKEIKAAESLN